MQKLSSISLAALMLGATFSAGQKAESAPNPTLRIHIPTEFNTENLTIISGIYGNGLGVSQVTTKSGHHDYSIPLGSKAQTVKLLIYAPGYKIVTAEFKTKNLAVAKPFVPRFDKLPTTPLKLKIVGTNGKAIANEIITLGHDLATHKYFGYADGMAFGATLLTASSNAQGEINFPMPLLAQDPYFARYAVRNVQISRGTGRLFFGNEDFRPTRLPLQKTYRQPIVVTRVYRAKLSGKIAPSFLRRHKIIGDITPYMDAKRHSPFRVELRAENSDSKAGYNCMLLKNGTFSAVLPTGTYRLHLVVLGKGETLHREITVQKNLRLQENEKHNLIIQ